MSKAKAKSTVQTVIENIYVKLASLLSPTEYRTSADVIEGFEQQYPDDWKVLVAKFGHRDDAPGKKNRGQHYAASTYIADRLASMKRMGSVDLKYTLDGYDTTVWKHNKRMGTWRLIRQPEPTAGHWKFLTVRVAGDTYEKLAAEANESSVSVASLAATRGVLVCVRHFGRFLTELERLAVALTEAKRLSVKASGNVQEAILSSHSAVEDAREEMMKCRDCRTRYEELRAVADAAERRRANVAG
jgi:hypothetical protein